MKSFKQVASFAIVLMLVPLTSQAEPLTTMAEVGDAVMSCWKPPAGVTKSSVTMRFSLKDDGSLIGPPEPTYINVAGDEKVRQTFLAAAADAVERCTPVELSPALAQGIGGQLFAMEFVSADKDEPIVPVD